MQWLFIGGLALAFIVCMIAEGRNELRRARRYVRRVDDAR